MQQFNFQICNYVNFLVGVVDIGYKRVCSQTFCVVLYLFKILWKRFLQTWRWFYTLVYGGLLFHQLHVGAHTCLKKIDLCGCVTINQCILKTELYNRLKHVIIKGNCKYSKLIFFTNFFCFIIYMYKYNQAKILLLLLCV